MNKLILIVGLVGLSACATPHPASVCAKICDSDKVDSWIGHRQMCFCKLPAGVSAHDKSNDLRKAAKEVAKTKPAQYDKNEPESSDDAEDNPESPR